MKNLQPEKLESYQNYNFIWDGLNAMNKYIQMDVETRCGYCLEPSENYICTDCRESLKELDQRKEELKQTVEKIQSSIKKIQELNKELKNELGIN